MECDMEYPNKLRFLRDATDFNQKAIADQLGIHQAEYGRMENGKRRIGKHLEKLAGILGCTTADIISDSPTSATASLNMMDFFALPDESGCIRFDQAMSTKIDRPPIMQNRENAFCMMNPNEENAPRLCTGDLCFCDPDEYLREDDLCVVRVTRGNRIVGCVKKFLGAGVFVAVGTNEEQEYGDEFLNAAPILSVIYAR